MSVVRRFHPVTFVLMLLLASGPACAEAPQLILATAWDESRNPTGWWLSEKYDGVRGYWNGERMLSCNGMRINIPDFFSATLPPFPVDGELWAGRGRFADTLSIVRDGEPGPGWRDIRYLIFDAPEQAGPFEARMDTIRRWLTENPSPRILLTEQTRCTGQRHLARALSDIEAKGGEGIMLRAAGSPYQSGRSTHLRKHKSFEDAEAEVTGYNPGKGKYRGMVGSLRVVLPDGTRFAVGSGLTDAQRGNPPPVGSIITFKHYGWTKYGKPRFPVYWRIRSPR
ncbi:DNA ligase [Thiohalomonas denitrificans]|uniref:DNA ligase n=1 Tax=Thiohalomonas denitrificans TaxID=415747 RepID=UPI0026EB25E4|nr:DNA ligase [Thiohalomonas denitrificans]